MTRHEAEPRAEISTPPIGPVWWKATCRRPAFAPCLHMKAWVSPDGPNPDGSAIVEFEAPNGTTAVFIKTRTWFDAREQAMLEFQLESEYLEVRQCGDP